MDSFHIQSVIHTPDHRGMSCQTSCVNSNRRGGKMSQTQHPTVEISHLFEKYILHYHVMKYNLQDRRKNKEIIICIKGPGQAWVGVSDQLKTKTNTNFCIHHITWYINFAMCQQAFSIIVTVVSCHPLWRPTYKITNPDELFLFLFYFKEQN